MPGLENPILEIFQLEFTFYPYAPENAYPLQRLENMATGLCSKDYFGSIYTWRIILSPSYTPFGLQVAQKRLLD